MKNEERYLGNYHHENEISEQANPEDAELAYQLQTTHQVDQDMLMRMVQGYGHSLYQWVGILLFYQKELPPQHAEIISTVKEVFLQATLNADQFHGQTSILDWLFGISYTLVKRYQKKKILAKRIADPVELLAGEWFKKHEDATDNSEILGNLPEKLRVPALLKYLFHFRIDRIASTLGLQTKEVHLRLKNARSRMVGRLPKTHMDDRIQAYLDGLLDEFPQDLALLQKHVEQCSLCRGNLEKLSALEKELSDDLQQGWIFPSFSESDINEVIISLSDRSKQSETRKKAVVPLRHAAWLAGIAVLLIGMVYVFVKLTPSESKSAQGTLTPTPELPPVIRIPLAKPGFQQNIEYIAAPQYINPAFSSDGKWAVFASIQSDPVTEAIILPTIELYNHEMNTVQIISESTAHLRLPWIWWDLAPSISGDGRHIVYVSAVSQTIVDGKPCATAEKYDCLDIFLYDRGTGETRRLTESRDGGEANGDSLAPTISQDGKWVAFWSAASNLVDGVNNTCQSSSNDLSCMFIYIYSLETGTIEWIPVRNDPGDEIFGVDRISLSGDGRYIGFTANSSDQLDISFQTNQSLADLSRELFYQIMPSRPMSFNTRQAVVYDRETGIYELINLAQDGKPGNGESSSPVLSADGRYVAFASASTNLVQVDINQASDVFLRDRESGRIEMISVSRHGWQGWQDSGISFWGRGYYSINLSADARYIVFESNASNLSEELQTECSRIHSRVCYVLYVHDRLTENTEQISVLLNGDFSFFPSISADGRWVTFMQSYFNCSVDQFFCSNVMLFDRQTGLLTNLTKNNLDLPVLPWSYAGSLALPWESWESTALTISPDGKSLALGGYDSKARVWQVSDEWMALDQANPEVYRTKGFSMFTVLAFSRDSQWLAAGTTTGDIFIWNLSDGRQVYTLNIISDPIKEMVFTSEGSQIIISTINETWILDIGDRIMTKNNVISYGSSEVYALDLSQNGNLLATARGDGTIWIQSLPDGRVIGRLGADGVSISNIAVSDDGTLLATRSSFGWINNWQIVSSEDQDPKVILLNSFRIRGYVETLTFSPDNEYLISTGRVGEITVWGVPEGKLFILPDSLPNEVVYSLAFTKEGNKLAVAFEDEIMLWGIPEGF